MLVINIQPCWISNLNIIWILWITQINFWKPCASPDLLQLASTVLSRHYALMNVVDINSLLVVGLDTGMRESRFRLHNKIEEKCLELPVFLCAGRALRNRQCVKWTSLRERQCRALRAKWVYQSSSISFFPFFPDPL